MRLTLWTDYALRTLIYLGAKGSGLSTIAEIAASHPRGLPRVRRDVIKNLLYGPKGDTETQPVPRHITGSIVPNRVQFRLPSVARYRATNTVTSPSAKTGRMTPGTSREPPRRCRR